MGEPYLAFIIVEQRGKTPPDSEIETHTCFGGVVLPHPLPLFLRDHLEGQLIVVAEEDTPLTVLRDGGCAAQDLPHILGASLFERHINTRHDREVESHLEFIAISKIRTDIFGPL